MSTSNNTPVSGAAFINALNQVAGHHPSVRASHAKGVCASGSFIPAPSITQLLTSPLFAGQRQEALVRFSVGGGNPQVSDSARAVRGVAVTLRSGVERYDLIMLSEAVFFAATPASFLSFMAARVPDPETGKPNPAKVADHNARFPDGVRQPVLVAAHPPSRSYLSADYFSNNAFCFIAGDGLVTTARLQLESAIGVQYLNQAEEAGGNKSFLADDLAQRLADGPAFFKLYALLPVAGDSLTDPSAEWQGKERILMGTLEIRNALPLSACEAHAFMPHNLPKGIEPSEDPILAIRPGAYAVSVTRRA